MSKAAVDAGNNIVAGWTSWQQILDENGDPISGYEFYTVPGNDYLFSQNYVKLNVPDAFAAEDKFENNAAELILYLKWASPNTANSVLGGQTWNQRLAGNGYYLI